MNLRSLLIILIIVLTRLTAFSNESEEELLKEQKEMLDVWNTLSVQEQWEVFYKTYRLMKDFETALDASNVLIQDQDGQIDYLTDEIKKRKPKTWGFSIGVEGGFLYNNQVVLDLAFKNEYHIIFLERIMLSPGYTITFREYLGAKLSLSVGFLF